MQVWPEIINKAKEGGLDVIETYVFWNYHEPVKGQVYITLAFDVDSVFLVVYTNYNVDGFFHFSSTTLKAGLIW